MAIPPPPAAAVELRLAGALDAGDAAAVAALASTLQAASGRPPVPLLRHEVVLAPRPAGKAAAAAGKASAPTPVASGLLRLSRDLHPPSSASPRDDGVLEWDLASVGGAVRGRGAAALPAAARAVTSTALAAADALALLDAAGFRVAYERVLDGHEYALYRGGTPIRVRVGRLLAVAPGAGPPLDRAADAAPGLLLVEATARAPEADYGAAATALGGVAEALRGRVELRKE